MCIYTYLCIYLYTHMCMYISLYVHIYIYIYTHKTIYVHTSLVWQRRAKGPAHRSSRAGLVVLQIVYSNI